VEHVFRVLLVWIDGEEYSHHPSAEEEITAGKFKVLAYQAERKRKTRSFVMVARRNWRVEVATRNVRLPDSLRELSTMPDGMAVDRLLGVQDGKRWRPGIAGLEPAEANVIRRKVLDRWPTWEVSQELHITPGSVRVYLFEARRKLRRLLQAGSTVTLSGDRPLPNGSPP